MRFLITLILLSCVSLVMAQSVNSDSKLDDEERRRLENQFKALKNFYINEQGLVVYQTQGSDAKPIERLSRNAIASDTLTVVVDEFTDDFNYSLNASEDINAERYESVQVKSSDSNEYNSYSAPVNASSGVVSISKRPTNPVFTNKAVGQTVAEDIVVSSGVLSAQAIPDESPITTNRIIAIPPATTTTSTQPDPVVSKTVIVDDSSTYNEEEIYEEEDFVEDEILPVISNRKSVFEKDPSRFRTLEEAAMAAQDLLDKLKTEQSRSSSSGSLSSRLSKGAGNSSLKKDQFSLNNSVAAEGQRNRPIISERTIESARRFEEASAVSTVEPNPTYFINGVQVDREVVDRLKRSDILSREVRNRNTQSGNPAGEVWIQLK